MATFTGFLAPSSVNVAQTNRPGWLSERLFNDTPTVYTGASVGISGTATLNNPLPISLSYTGFLAGGYGDIFYNRILISPLLVDVGNLISGQTREVLVFNAFFSSVTLNAIVSANNEGVLLTGPATPLVLSALQEQNYSLTISLEGPPEIDATFTFQFADSIDDIVIRVIGSRIVLLPYYSSAPATERLEWLTQVLTARDGTEQRITLRKSPRQQMTFNSRIAIPELSRVSNLFYGWRKRVWAVPIWSEARIASSVVENDQSITVDTRFGDFRVNGLAVIWNSERKFDIFEIISFTDNQINLDRGINADYANASVVPVRLMRMTSDPNRNTNGVNGSISVAFESIDNVELISSFGSEPFSDGIEVYLEEPLLNPDFIDDRYNSRVDVVDFQTMAPSIFSPWVFTKINRQFLLVLEGLQEIWEFRQWLHRRSGRAIPFYMSSFENDFRFVDSSGEITSTLVFFNDEQATQGVLRTRIVIKLFDGTLLYRTIDNIGVDASNNVVVNLDTPLVGVDIEDVELVSYIGIKRLTSDRIEFQWLPNNVARVVVPITEVQP